MIEEEDEMPDIQRSVKNIADSMSIVSSIIERNDKKDFNDWLNAGDVYITTTKEIKSNSDWLKNVLIPFLIDNEHYEWIKFVQLKIDIQHKIIQQTMNCSVIPNHCKKLDLLK